MTDSYDDNGYEEFYDYEDDYDEMGSQEEAQAAFGQAVAALQDKIGRKLTYQELDGIENRLPEIWTEADVPVAFERYAKAPHTPKFDLDDSEGRAEYADELIAQMEDMAHWETEERDARAARAQADVEQPTDGAEAE